jgi:hypothetical protein
MAAPKRPTKKKEPAKSTLTDRIEEGQERIKSESTPQEEQAAVVETETVDKDALIKELQAQVLSEKEHKNQVEELQKQLAEAEKQAGSTANAGVQDFKTKPGPDDEADFFFFEIIWHPKRSDSDEEFVTLGVNGKIMLWPRDKPTVIRSDYLEVADNAFVPKFTQLPGEDRKEIGGLKPFTYTIKRKITEEEYRDRKKEGDAALRNDLSSKGMSV